MLEDEADTTLLHAQRCRIKSTREYCKERLLVMYN